MKAYILLSLLTLAGVGGGCRLDDLTKEDDTRDEEAVATPSHQSCQPAKSLSCIEGKVIQAPWIALDGVAYFDAAELGSSLLSHVAKVEGARFFADEPVVGEPLFDNDSFSQGFRVFLKGARALSGRVSRDGYFQLNDITPGHYDILVQRLVKVEMPPQAGEAKGRTLCLTIFAEAIGKRVNPSESLFIGIDDYSLSSKWDTCET